MKNNKSFRAKPVGWKGESHRHYLASKGVKTKINWRTPRRDEVVEWWTPREFVKRTHNSDIENIPVESPYYEDDELGTKFTLDMPFRLENAEEVDLLESIHSDEPNKSINQGRHRAYSAWYLKDKKVPVVVKRGEDYER